MQILLSEFTGKPVMGVHTGEQICVITDCIIHKENLKILLFVTQTGLKKESLYLLPNNIRFSDSKRLIVDSASSLSDFEELVRYQHDILHSFNPIRKKVVTLSGKKLGIVTDYSFDNQHNFVQKLYVASNFFKRLLQARFVIDRSAIIETTANSIVVKDSVVTENSTIKNVLPSNQENKVSPRTTKDIPN